VVSATALRFDEIVSPMFTALIGEIARRFDLGTRAAALVNELPRLIIRTPGGLAGFLARFEAADMGLLASSWLGNSESEPMPSAQLERVLGADALRRIGRKVGLPADTAGAALAFLIPRVIGLLTPNGVVPSDMPVEARTLLATSAQKPRRSG
jgi:uncharacterized protein YidB (DUF937 family)